MVRFLATVLLLVQLRPVAVAAACAMQAPTHERCEMTSHSPGAPGHSDRSHHEEPGNPSAPGCECQGAPVCAVNTGLSLPSLIRTTASGGATLGPIAITSASLHTSDPTAPPVPPPNA